MTDRTVDPGDPSTDPDTKYRFVPVVRRGYPPAEYYEGESAKGKASLDTQSTMQVDFRVTGENDSGTTPKEDHVRLQMYGPGHVTGLDSRQVVRTEPEPGTTNYPPNYLATVEFDAVDLPWLFSLVSDDTLADGDDPPTGKGFPWCCLVVLEKTEDTRVEPAGADRPLPSIEAPVRELPPLDEAWAWAHAQVVGSPQRKGDSSPEESSDQDGGGSGEQSDQPEDPLAAAFESESKLTRSRLVSPRNLQNGRKYIAAVVPTFEAGRKAGLGEAPSEPGDGDEESETMQLAWAPADTNAVDDGGDGDGGGDDGGGSSDRKRLPVYHHWEFATGKRGDFEYLARKLEPRDLAGPSYDIGFRQVDVSDPGPSSLELWGDDPSTEENERTVRLGGALRKGGADPIEAEDYAKYDALRELLNDPAAVDEWADEEFAAEGPPIYGRWHAQRESLPASIPHDQNWLWDLNLHPGHRLAAAVGASIVRDNQQQLMDQAWEQVGQIRAANRKLAAAQLSREALEAASEGLDSAPTGWMAGFTGPMHDRLLTDDGRTVGAQLDDSQFPRGLTSAPLRRLLSGSGRLAKRLDGAVDVGKLVEDVANDRVSVTTPERRPDGMGAAADDPDLEALCDTVPALPRDRVGRGDRERPEPVQELLGALTELEARCRRLLELLSELAAALREQPNENYQLPADSDGMQDLVDDLRDGSDGVRDGDGSSIPAIVIEIDEAWRALAQPVDELGGLMRPVAERRREFEGVDNEFAPPRSQALHQEISAVASRDLLEFGAGLGIVPDPLSIDDVAEAQSDVLDLLDGLASVRSYLESRERTDNAYLDRLLCGPEPGQPADESPDLEAATRTDPVGALVERVGHQLGGIDLDADHRRDPLDRVMAYPEFPKPTYDDLADVFEQYLLPGVEEVPKNTFGAVETNPQFIESFLVGMNHEMGAELLWRRFPADRRGSYFRQFWDPSARVPKPEDEQLKDITEVHTWDDKDDPEIPGDDRTGRSELGSNVMTGAGGANGEAGTRSEPNSQVVVLVRGELLERYPTTTIYATKARRPTDPDESAQDRVPEWPTPNEIDEKVDTTFHRYLIFRGELDPDVTFLGFDLSRQEATGATATESLGEPDPSDPDHWVNDNGTDNLGWFFVMEEPPGEIRFGLDANQGDIGATPPGITDRSGETHTTSDPDEDTEYGWSALSWGHLVASQSALDEKQNVSVYRDRPYTDDWRTEAGKSWVDDDDDDGAVIAKEEAAVWGRNSADMAYITWQRPVRIAIHADDLLPADDSSNGGN